MKSFKDTILEAIAASQMKKNKVTNPARAENFIVPGGGKHHYSVYEIGAGGTLKNRQNLGHDELEVYVHDPKLPNRTANIKVVRNDGNAVTYTHTGKEWAIVSKEKLQKGSKYIP